MKFIDWLLVLALLVFSFSSSLPQPSSVVVVYESEEFLPPPFVYGALKESGLASRVVDQHIQNGNGETPAGLAAAIAAGQEHGLPALVFLSGLKVSRVVKLPNTKEKLSELLQ